MYKILFIGPVNKGEIPKGGQIAKCQFIVNYMDVNGLNYELIDSYGKGKLKVALISISKVLFNRKCQVLIHLGSVSAAFLIIGFFFTGSLHRTGYLIVGNWFPYFFKKNKYLKFFYNKLNFLSIEGGRTGDTLKKMGLVKVKSYPHFKKIYDLGVNNSYELQHRQSVKFLFLARVCEDKGVDIAIEAIVKLNKEGIFNYQVELDIYGKIDDDYQHKFEELINMHEFINYKGQVDLGSSAGYEKLNEEDYYAYLFPTKYRGEGFAGTFIDAMILGLPVIASNWNLNSEVVVDKINGIILSENNPEKLMDSIKWLLKNPEARENMSENQIKTAKLYDVDFILSKIFEDIYSGKNES